MHSSWVNITIINYGEFRPHPLLVMLPPKIHFLDRTQKYSHICCEWHHLEQCSHCIIWPDFLFTEQTHFTCSLGGPRFSSTSPERIISTIITRLNWWEKSWIDRQQWWEGFDKNILCLQPFTLVGIQMDADLQKRKLAWVAVVSRWNTAEKDNASKKDPLGLYRHYAHVKSCNKLPWMLIAFGAMETAQPRTWRHP